MGLFKEVKKPVIKHSVADGAGGNSLAPPMSPKPRPACIAVPVAPMCAAGWSRWPSIRPMAARRRRPSNSPGAQILENNPFPAICGRVCQHPCELNCNRKAKDSPLAVNKLEQFVGDFAIANALRAEKPSLRSDAAPRIAVVGAGPAGLSAAYHLARKGLRGHRHRRRASARRHDALFASRARSFPLKFSMRKSPTFSISGSSSAPAAS